MKHRAHSAPSFSITCTSILLTASCLLPVTAVPDGSEPIDRRQDTLSPDTFAAPPRHTRSGCFWAWLNGNITREQITRDLEEMKRGGMRGGEIWDVKAHMDPDGRVPAGPPFLGPESTRLIVHAIHEADRLGMELGLVASSGWNAGGSWVTPVYAGKGLYHASVNVQGPTKFQKTLPEPAYPGRCPKDEQGRPLHLRQVAVVAVPDNEDKTLQDVDQVIDLTDQVNEQGVLHWDVPDGSWTILRFACTNHGQQLIVPSPNSGGPMIDFLDPEATKFHLRHIMTTILNELGRDTFENTSFKAIEFDSMELHGFTPWTDTMTELFHERLGYSIVPYLPLLADWELADQVTQEQFLFDWKKLVSDRLIESHYATGSNFLKEYGLSLIAEAGGPGPPIWASNPVDGITALGAVDIPRGEFWIKHRGIFLVKEIASAAHVYGKRLVDAESFTTWRRWVDGPLNHKDLADRALCEGLNCFSGHTFASSPPEAGLPGWAYHAGTDINATATWWPMVRDFMDYLARCSYMLRQGWFVADVCYYYGDQAPNFFPPLCNVPEKPGLEGLNRGYDFDVCSSEVILERMQVDRGRIVLPDGMSYAALVLPNEDPYPADVLEKVRDLVKKGATVVAHRPPEQAPSLKNNDQETRRLKGLVEELWGADSRTVNKVQTRQVGQGRFLIADDRSKALHAIGVTEDFLLAGRAPGDLGPLDFLHRTTVEDDFYFVRNKTREAQELACRFRVADRAGSRAPELWWPESGQRTVCREWSRSEDGYLEITVALGPLGSVFVVFPHQDSTRDAPADTLVIPTFEPAPTPILLDGPWRVAFPEGWGAPSETTFEHLHSWTESEEEGIRLFSGIATYLKTFELPEDWVGEGRSHDRTTKETSVRRLFLELGDLAEIAEVTLNGKDLGVVWLPPFRVEITGAVRAGTNRLEIRVANLWANRLNGDSLLPESERFTRSNLDRIQTDFNEERAHLPRGETRPVYKEMPPLMRSGLFGPVRVVTPKKSL